MNKEQMREIKFRGKTVNNGELVYGYLVDQLHIVWKDSNGKSYEEEVIPETIGQYTGLKDINGKEIYEGDIIRFADNRKRFYPGIYKIAWESYGFTFSGKDDKYAKAMDEYDVVKVIDNIHDNLELMKEE